jgi:hypothetical protein
VNNHKTSEGYPIYIQEILVRQKSHHISGKYRTVFAEFLVNRWPVSANIGFVHYIVVKQCKIVKNSIAKAAGIAF